MQTQHEWETAVVRDVVLKTATWNPAKEPRDTIRYVDVSAVSRERSAIEEATDYSANQAPGRARKIIHTNDTIFATIRPSLRRIAQVSERFDNELASTAFCVLRPNPKKIDPVFLFHAVSSEPFVEAVVNLETGASYPAVRDRDILDQSIPLPPIAEQKDIGSSLNLVRAALLHQSNSLTVAQELKRAAMRELFTKGLRGEPQKQTDIGLVPESWDVKAVGGYIHKPDYGFTASASSEAVGPRFLRITDIQDGGVNWNTVPFCASDTASVASKGLKKNDIVVARIGATTGKAFIIGECPEAIFASYLIRIRADETKLVPAFLYYYMQTDAYWQHIDQHKGGRLKGGVNIPILSSLPIPIVEKEEQHEIAQILDAIDRKIDLHKRKKAVLEELFKSLLHKLMTGEIRVSDLDLTAIQQSEAA